jgi:AcrR family transcriptional regulator
MQTDNPSRGDQTRANILAQAYRLFLKQGYHGTSMRQIADAADIALGAIYNHFSGKEALFKEVFLENHPYQEMLPAVIAASGDDPEGMVRDMARRMVDALLHRPAFLNLLFIELVEFNSVHTVELYENILPQVTQSIERMMNTWKDRIRPVPPVVLARAFIGLFFSYYLTDQILKPITKLPAPLQTQMQINTMDNFVDIFLHGILKGEI